MEKFWKVTQPVKTFGNSLNEFQQCMFSILCSKLSYLGLIDQSF